MASSSSSSMGPVSLLEGGKKRAVTPSTEKSIGQLFMASLRSAVVASEFLSNVELVALFAVNKEASAIVHESVKTLRGGARLLTVVDRFPRATTLHLSLCYMCYDKRSPFYTPDHRPWQMPTTIIQHPPDLRRIRHLSIDVSPKHDYSGFAKLAEGNSHVNDPLTDIIMPGLAHAHLKSLAVTCRGKGMPIPEGLRSLLLSPAVSLSLTHLSISVGVSSGRPVDDIILAIWPAMQQAGLPRLQSLSIKGPIFPSYVSGGTRGAVALFRGLASKQHLPSLTSLRLDGSLMRVRAQASGEVHALTTIAHEQLDLSHLTNIDINDYDIPTLLALLNSNRECLQSFACRLMMGMRPLGKQITSDAPVVDLVGMLRKLMGESSPLAVRGMTLKAMMSMSNWNWSNRYQSSVEKMIVRGVASYVGSWPEDPIIIDYLIPWFRGEKRSCILEAMCTMGDCASATQQLISISFRLAVEGNGANDTAASRRHAIIFLMACLNLLVKPDYFLRRSGITDAVLAQQIAQRISAACGLTPRQLLTSLLPEFREAAAYKDIGIVSIIRRSMAWTVQEIVEDVGSPVLCILIDRDSGYGDWASIMEPLADELSHFPPRFSIPIVEALGGIVGAPYSIFTLTITRAPPGTWRSDLLHALLAPQRWPGLWRSVAASVASHPHRRNALNLMFLLEVARDRGLDLKQEDTKAVLKKLDLTELCCHDKTLPLASCIVAMSYSSPDECFHHAMEGAVGLQQRGVKPDDQREIMNKILVGMLAMRDATAGPSALTLELLIQGGYLTNKALARRLLPSTYNDDDCFSPWHRRDLPIADLLRGKLSCLSVVLTLRALPILARLSPRLLQDMVTFDPTTAPHQSVIYLLSTLYSATRDKKHQKHDERGDAVLTCMAGLARAGPALFLMSLAPMVDRGLIMEGTSRKPRPLKCDEVVEIIRALRDKEVYSIDSLRDLLTLKLAPAAMDSSYVNVIKRIRRSMAKGPLKDVVQGLPRV